MGRGWLWALDKRGQAYRLSASPPVCDSNDEILLSKGLEHDSSIRWQRTVCQVPLRKFAASATCAWGIGSNSKPYLFLYASDCPCRVTEEVYENQRWYPLSGFTSYLLPTDRDAWSDAVGNPSVPPEHHVLPSAGWEWEDPWTPDCSARLADKEGWAYASNFNRPYCNWRFPAAFIRRRRWIRTRRYTAVERWIKIDIPSKYSLMDIAVGGTDVLGSVFLCVWALASDGKVLFRSGVSPQKPEGDLWCEIDAPPEIEFNQLSCSPSTGRLIAVSWEGRLFQRTDQLNTDVIGIDWAALPAPAELRFLNVALGDHVIWAINMDGRAWFARFNTDVPAEAPLGEDSWLEMACSMSHLSVGPSDQVFGVGLLDDTIYYRTDITEKELSGRLWQAVLPAVASDVTVMESETKTVGDESNSLSGAAVDSKTITIFDGRTLIRNISKKKLRKESGEASRVTPLVVSFRRSQVADGVVKLFSTEEKEACAQTGNIAEETEDVVCGTPPSGSTYQTGQGEEDEKEAAQFEEEGQECATENDLDKEDSASSIHSEETSQHASDVSEACSGFWAEPEESDSVSSSIFTSNQWSNDRWILTSAGGCSLSNTSLHENSGPPRIWFEDPTKSRSSARRRPKIDDYTTCWRKAILQTLSQRNAAIWAAFGDFACAFERGTWVRTLSCRVWSGYHRKWCEVILQLTQSWRLGLAEHDCGDRSIGLAVKCVDARRNGYSGKCGHVGVQDILCVRREFDSKANKFLLVVYARKIEGDSGVRWDFPLKFACKSEEDQKAWILAIDEATARYQHALASRLSSAVTDPIGPDAVWAVASNGAVYVCQPGGKCLIKDAPWRFLGGHFKMVESGIHGIVWGLGYDGRLWFFTPTSLNQIQDDIRMDVVYENQRWSRLLMKYVPLPRLMSGVYYAWSDETGRVNTPKESFKLPGSEWQWLSDWKVDFALDCDSDGWQYSRSFRSPFVGQKKFNYSAVRRRRWIRRRRVITTVSAGSWRLVEPSPSVAGREANFVRVVLESDDKAVADNRNILVFAVTTDGDLFCRMDVSMERPEGQSWRHVLTGVRVADVSIGVDRNLWAVGQLGFAYCCYAANHGDLLSSGWREILPPQDGKYRLKRIVAGNYSVYALDTESRLYSRLGCTPYCPEGVGWVPVVNTTATIENISLSKDNQLWALLKSNSLYGSAIARRYDIRGYNTLWDIDWWDICNVDGWIHVSANSYKSSMSTTESDRKPAAIQPRQVLTMTRILSKNGTA